MIELSNLRKYAAGRSVRLEADITFTDMLSPCMEKTLYFEVEEANGDMLADDTYDAFVLVPLYLAMFHKQDLHIRGNISKKLYQNIKWYIPRILCDFSDDLAPVKFTVDGFTSPRPKGNLIGTGISCGMDSLSTIYDHFVKETDSDYRINALFMFNCGTHGDFEDSFTQNLFMNRYRRNVNAANELGLPVCLVNSNLHAFTHKVGSDPKCGYLAIYSCILSLQNAIFRYYSSNGSTYEQKKTFRNYNHNHDMAGFCDSYLVPLIQIDNPELIIEGCQYRRVDKIKKIVDRDITQKYLNVSVSYELDARNCGHCSKCLRTLLPLEILGKLDDFANIFDLAAYREKSLNYKAKCVANVDKNLFCREIVEFAAENNFPLPTRRDCYTLGRQVVIFDDK